MTRIALSQDICQEADTERNRGSQRSLPYCRLNTLLTVDCMLTIVEIQERSDWCQDLSSYGELEEEVASCRQRSDECILFTMPAQLVVCMWCRGSLTNPLLSGRFKHTIANAIEQWYKVWQRPKHLR